MLNSKIRNTFYFESLNSVAKDKIVLDIGTGTGILAAYALRAGAKFVYAVEMNPASAKMAQTLLSQCFDQSRFKVINANFWTSEVDGQIPLNCIDIMVSETIGPGLFDQGMIKTWDRVKPFLKSTAISIPDRLHFDLVVWNKKIDVPESNDFSHYANIDLKLIPDNLLDDKFAAAIGSYVDSEFRNKPHLRTGWCNIKEKISIEPDQIYYDIVDITKDTLPSFDFIENNNEAMNHIQPNLEFTLNLDGPGPYTVAMKNKISFKDRTLDIDNVECWKYSPIFKFDSSGKFKFRLRSSAGFMQSDLWIISEV
jgi:SAM-dependent methyltransferase